MRNRLVMYPSDTDLLEVNERLNAMEMEAEAARTLQALIQHVAEVNRLPKWFKALPRKAFASARAKTIRYTIPENHPALQELIAEMLPLSQGERALRVSVLLRKACVPPTSIPDVAHGLAGEAQAPIPAVPLVIAPLKPLEVAQDDEPIDPDSLKKRLKDNLTAFL